MEHILFSERLNNMTATVTLANMPSSPTDVAVNFLNQALLKRRKFTVVGGQISTEYVYASGDPTQETSVLVTVNVNEAANTIRTSISLKTVQVVTDTVVTEVAPVIVSITWTTPGAAEDTAKLIAMIGTCFGLVMNGVTTKVPNTGIIDALNRGIADDLYS